MTEIMQRAPAATELPQVLLSAKSALAAMLAIESAEAPVLVSDTFLTALVAPTTSSPNFRALGESVTVCAKAPAAERANKIAATRRGMGLRQVRRRTSREAMNHTAERVFREMRSSLIEKESSAPGIF